MDDFHIFTFNVKISPDLQNLYPIAYQNCLHGCTKHVELSVFKLSHYLLPLTHLPETKVWELPLILPL